jgi:ankyrin repeat protein
MQENYPTPLSLAAVKGHKEVVKLLLAKGTDIESRDSVGRSPRSWAAGNRHTAVLELLLNSVVLTLSPKTKLVELRYHGQ